MQCYESICKLAGLCFLWIWNLVIPAVYEERKCLRDTSLNWQTRILYEYKTWSITESQFTWTGSVYSTTSVKWIAHEFLGSHEDVFWDQPDDNDLWITGEFPRDYTA